MFLILVALVRFDFTIISSWQYIHNENNIVLSLKITDTELCVKIKLYRLLVYIVVVAVLFSSDEAHFFKWI